MIPQYAVGSRPYAVGSRAGRRTARIPSSLPTADCRLPSARGFTLIELLVVILIILIVSAVALPTVLPAMAHREVSEAARLLQGALVGARDKAIRTNLPSGIRLLPDPALLTYVTKASSPFFGQVDASQILAVNRLIPLDPAPEYSEGLLDIIKSPLSAIFQPQGGSPKPLAYWGGGGGTYPLANVLMVTETFYATGTCPPRPNSPTNWFWNIRVGDKIQVNNAGPWYTVVGPMAIPPAGTTINGTFYSNPEMFVNVGPPGVPSPLVQLYGAGTACPTRYQPDFLFLVNSRDDNGNGWIDEGWDGVDNNGNGLVDELLEWEAEQLLGAAQQSLLTIPLTNQSYTIKRRPAPSPNSREIALPSGVVIDLTGWGPYLNASNQAVLPPQERSHIPPAMINRDTGYVDIVLNPDGTVLPTTVYSSPSSFPMASSFVHLWLAERGDLAAPTPSQTSNPFLPLPQGLAAALFAGSASPISGQQELKGEYALVTLFTRTGQILTNRNMPFLFNPNEGGYTNNPPTTANPLQYYNSNWPYAQAQQGVQAGQ